MSDLPTPGRSLVTRRAITDVVRAAVRTSYGVTGVDVGPLDRLLGSLGLREPGIRVRVRPSLEIELALTIGSGLPIAEVARQVDSAVRYAIRRSVDREVDRLTIHVAGLHDHPASIPPPRATTDDPAEPAATADRPPADAA